MNNSFRLIVVLACLLLSLPVAVVGQVGQVSWHGSGQQGAVSAGRTIAVQAGMEILKNGGNAIDSMAATVLALSINGQAFGGEVPIIVYDAKRKVVEVLSGQGVAPRLATLEHFLKQNRKTIPRQGIIPAAVPSVLDTIVVAVERYGTMRFSQIAQPTLRVLLKEPEEKNQNYARTIQRLMAAEKAAGPDRKSGLAAVRDYFYRGPIARELDQWSRQTGGLLRYTDLATHVTRIEEPIKIDYRGYTIYKCNTWTQGPYLLQTLQLLEPFDVKAMGHNSPDYIHLLTEAMKLALADRDQYYGDPLFVDVPLQALLAKKYADLRRPLIDMKKASLEIRPGDPKGIKALLDKSKSGTGGETKPSKDTTTCVVADSSGNVVVATFSGWGGPPPGKTGIILGTRLQSFNLWPGHPNCIEPGKRPRITLTPTLVLKNGKPIIAISVAGGDLQDQVALQVLLNTIEFGFEPTEAVTAPRFSTDHLVGSFCQPRPKLCSLNIYKVIDEQTIDELKSRGHRIKLIDGAGAPSMISLDPKTGQIKAAGDPRSGRHADAF